MVRPSGLCERQPGTEQPVMNANPLGHIFQTKTESMEGRNKRELHFRLRVCWSTPLAPYFETAIDSQPGGYPKSSSLASSQHRPAPPPP